MRQQFVHDDASEHHSRAALSCSRRVRTRQSINALSHRYWYCRCTNLISLYTSSRRLLSLLFFFLNNPPPPEISPLPLPAPLPISPTTPPPTAAPTAFTPANYQVFARDLSLSTNGASDGGMQTILQVAGGVATTAAAAMVNNS